MTAALIFRRQLVRPKALNLQQTRSRVQAATPDHILMFPPPIFRSGVLRQGFDKFYSVSFQARHSFFVSSLTPGSPES
jgi:hypothetical protein